MKKILILLLVSLFFILTSCTRIYGNYPNTIYATLDVDEKAGTVKVFEYLINLKNYEYYEKSQDEDVNVLPDNYFKGGTAPKMGNLNIPNGFDKLETHLNSLDIGVIDVQGFVNNNEIKGIVNVYDKTAGYLSGGGNYAVEEINYGALFHYNALEDKFVIVEKIPEAVIVSAYENTLLYWKKEAYYSYNIDTSNTTYLVKDKAYDKGLTHYSYTNIVTYGDMVFIIMTKGKMSTDITYIYYYNYRDNKIEELKKGDK